MNPRHAAALALVGWYLMVPPLNDRGYPDTSAPMKSWQLEDSFDTADECKAGRYDKYLKDEGFWKKYIAQHPDAKAGITWHLKTKRDLLALAQCIASDDPRLKGK